MKLILCDINREMVRCWQDYFRGLPQVEIRLASIFEVRCDALASPTNSFGLMDGGLDLRVNEFFNYEIETRVREVIWTKHGGELLVGSAEVISTGHSQVPYLIVAPTMRVPMMIDGTVNVFLAMRAILRTVQTFNREQGGKIRSLAVPGLGTGVGAVPCDIAASQMRIAYDHVILQSGRIPGSWLQAKSQHEALAEGLKL